MLWLKIAFFLICFVPPSFGAPAPKKISQKEAAEKLVSIATIIQNHEVQLSTLEHELNQARAQESEILEALDHYNQRLIDTIHYLRHATQSSPLLAMLSAPRPEDVIHSFMLLRSITPEIHHRNQQLLEKLERLSQIRSKLEANQNQLQDLTFHYYQEREKLDSLLNARSQHPIPDPTPANPTQNETSQNDPNELTLKKPVKGKLISTYGSSDPEWTSYAQGVLFITRSEAQVVSPISGTIVFAGDYATGQGKMISVQTPQYLIIMSGLETLNRNCLVGQNIIAGEPIGLMNKKNLKKLKVSTKTMPRLYLEVWHQEQTIDPQSVLQETKE